MNTWEVTPYEYSHGGNVDTQESLIYPGLYAPSQYNVMQILVHIYNRPDKKVDLGPVDASCPIVLCDMMEPDQPIIYASDAFLYLTGYSSGEVLGRNCRFLQAPGGKVKPKSTRKHVDKDTIRRMRKAVEKQAELQVEVVNFKKNGQRFVNLLTMIPVSMDGRAFCVGFQSERE
ncbi:putative vivid protein [Lasiosphaeria hispida]|uniref:Vivid protein n=1 Tax=Lasiosphaeria hispida TaxID=260671 RepID=A0AAJ0MCB3_9PEZI|nr:putative vivid protein [Lasiosphaeria hispida]